MVVQPAWLYIALSARARGLKNVKLGFRSESCTLIRIDYPYRALNDVGPRLEENTLLLSNYMKSIANEIVRPAELL